MNHPTIFPIQRFQSIKTPFYYYNLDLLKKTIATVKEEAGKYENFHVHYAIKANANKHILSIISENRLGADCVSGGEIQAAVDAGFPADKIVFAGVGKSDWEIKLALEQGISCFNVESLPELDIISQLAEARGVKATIAFRVNPNVDAHTHAKITTGLNENKFGIAMEDLLPAVKHAQSLPSIIFSGLHFHIGSQILHLEVYESLCQRINELQDQLERNNISCATINVGGGLGINYEAPDADPIPAFAAYFKIFGEHLKLRPGQSLHFELGRSIVAQCGTLIAKTLYVKHGHSKKFVIADAGFTELIRPAMYGAHHFIENLSAASNAPCDTYDVVGPICESSDVFGKDIQLPHCQRGDLIAFRSAGAYGEVMASTYNCRQLPKSYFSDSI